MKSCDHKDDVIFKRNGTNQENRFNHVLDPDNIELHDFEIEDWILFAYNFGKHVGFFKTDDSQTPAGNWQEMFNHFGITDPSIPERTERSYGRLKKNISETIAGFEAKNELTPHVTLFVCFLRLLELSKKRFNKLTQKHLDFYYKQMLQVKKLPAREDKVHVIFEIAKGSVEEKIEVNTKLDGNKDADGNKRVYQTTEELITNKAVVSQLKNLYNDLDLQEIKSSDIANSLDGKGKPLPEDGHFWWPFGYTSEEQSYPELEAARLGFAIASPMFDLQEGDRNIAITVFFDDQPPFPASEFDVDDLIEHMEVFCSGEKEWLGPFQLEKDIVFKENGDDVVQSPEISATQLRLVFQIAKDHPAVTHYHQKTLGKNFSSSQPIIRFIIKTENQKGHYLFRKLVKKAVKNIHIKIDVRDISSLILENDTGILNASKPFYPFSTQPVKGSSFVIDYPEMFSKKWSNADINIKWKNTPDSFVTHYNAYKKSYLNQTSKAIFFEGMFVEVGNSVLEANQPEMRSAASPVASPGYQLNSDKNDLIVGDDDYFTASLEVSSKEEWKKNANVVLFKKPDSTSVFELNTSISGADLELGKNGPFRLSLNQSFLHSLFPRIYTLALTSDNEETLIPNEPYTPFADTITLNYTAEENIDFSLSDESAYQNNRIRLFHEAAFGQYEEHSFLKKLAKENAVLGNNADINCWLVPDYCKGGELYIGLGNSEAIRQVSLLVQLLEGSENPLGDSFVGRQGVEWAVLCENQWKSLEDHIISDNISNFLKSGIVKFSIPQQATQNNTLLPKDHIWIRAKIHKAYDAICKVIDIKSQAVLAEFIGENNHPAHLENGLPAGSISKLIMRVPQIKGVSQPFSSFGGLHEEADTAYYRRVSERLRHKNRAITLWDYEHLILQAYPEVYKIKCLNHTSATSFVSPGDVLLVVVPDIINKNVFDIYEPRLSKNMLDSIQSYINNLNTMHVDAVVINPEYEKVVVRVGVKFFSQYDEKFYRKQLNEDIKKFLSPWAFDQSEEITFGVELHSSILIDCIEGLYYVDYLEELQMAKHPNELDQPDDPTADSYLNQLSFVQVLTCESPKHILVSAKQHAIFTDIQTCSATPIEEAETCQY